VPRRFLKIDDDAVQLAGKGWREGDPQPIPGVEFYVEARMNIV